MGGKKKSKNKINANERETQKSWRVSNRLTGRDITVYSQLNWQSWVMALGNGLCQQ